MRFHAPRAYRYEIAYPAERRVMLNCYGWQLTGIAVVISHHAYCLRWAQAT